MSARRALCCMAQRQQLQLEGNPDSEGQLALLAIIHRKALQHQASKSTACSTTTRVVHHEPLQAGAIICKFADAVKNQVYNLLTNGVVATRKVVGCILLAWDELLWVEELTVCAPM